MNAFRLRARRSILSAMAAATGTAQFPQLEPSRRSLTFLASASSVSGSSSCCVSPQRRVAEGPLSSQCLQPNQPKSQHGASSQTLCKAAFLELRRTASIWQHMGLLNPASHVGLQLNTSAHMSCASLFGQCHPHKWRSPNLPTNSQQADNSSRTAPRSHRLTMTAVSSPSIERLLQGSWSRGGIGRNDSISDSNSSNNACILRITPGLPQVACRRKVTVNGTESSSTANPATPQDTSSQGETTAQGAAVAASTHMTMTQWQALSSPFPSEQSIAKGIKDPSSGSGTPFADETSEAFEVPPWTSAVWASSVEMKRRIFCNRSLNMKSIVAVGFDMDYTLAQYRPDTFETMAYKETVKKLVENLGYPDELLGWSFDWKYMVRGLVLDKKRGNILKMDRHKYVKVAYHGFRELSQKERLQAYGNTLARDSFDEPDYALIDTLFSLAEAYLFAQLVDYRDAKHPEQAAGASGSSGDVSRSYAGIYKDVREAVDLCHRDGTLKLKVAADPGKYIFKDDNIVPMIQMLRGAGRITFLVTNSLWDYSHIVMNYLCGKCGTRSDTARDNQWLELFDMVITGSAKPGFFRDTNRAPLFEVDPQTGMLRNTDGGTPLVQLGDVTPVIEPVVTRSGDKKEPHCRVFQGGNVSHLYKMLGIGAGAQVLYVGDHIYGDILRSKKLLGWRTMLVVPELNEEVIALRATQQIWAEFHHLRQQRDALEDAIQRLERAQRAEHHDSVEELYELRHDMESLKVQRDAVREKHRVAMREVHRAFHPVWGQLMKTGYQNSRFAHQVERFACLYTSQVANLIYYSPDKSYRTSEDFMPHEFDIADGL
eukprot:TRINITY_DN2870_c0_g1_i1.p1 TRINITY_DN2870_c0_g1~~TRINITY_DN2870_c0_g1_i1.p1  ORF type:complete len:826 (+),score=111.88 TRINITY_DN2870_c0_g1_i1:747-3224(+)